MKHTRIISAILCGLILSLSGAWAAVFPVGAPTGNPANDTTAIQTAINSAMASVDPTNIIQLQAGTTYVLAAPLMFAGTSRNATLTTAAGTKTILVAPNYTAGNAWTGVVTINDTSNCTLGIANLVIIPAPFSQVGSSIAADTIGIGMKELTYRTTLYIEDVVIAANNNANQPISYDGMVNPALLTNITVFGNANINFLYAVANANPGNRLYMNRVVSTAANNECLFIAAAGTPVETRHHNWGDRCEARNCVFSYSNLIFSTGPLVGVFYAGDVVFENCQFFDDGPIGAYGAEIGGNDSLTLKRCVFHDTYYGCLARRNYVSLVENTTTYNNGIYGYGERFAPVAAAIQSTTTIIRDCTSLYDHADPTYTATTSDWSHSGFNVYAPYATVERCTVIGGATTTAGGNGGVYGITIQDVIKGVVRDCYVQNFNRAGIFVDLGTVTGNVLIERCVVEDCGTNAASIFGPVQQDGAYGSTPQRFAPIGVDLGGTVVVQDCTVRRTKAPAVFVNFANASFVNSTALLQNLTLQRCAEKLVDVRAPASGSNNQITVRNVVATGDPLTGQVAGVGTGIRVAGADALVEDCTITDRIEEALMNNSSGPPPAAGHQHTYQDVYVQNVGGPGIVVSHQALGKTVVSNCVVKDVTGGNGVELRGGQGTVLSGVQILNASQYGVAMGVTGFSPIGPTNIASMDDLCIMACGQGGLRFRLGDNAQPPMTLTNSTILDTPVSVTYDHLFGQVLQVTDCILAGDNPGGIGIWIPSLVVDGPSGSPAPRVRVWTSALVGAGPWALATTTQVDPSNPGGTVTQTGIVTTDPVFASTTPGDANFLAVRSNTYGGMATNVGAGQSTNLDGCSYYIGDSGIAAWRMF